MTKSKIRLTSLIIASVGFGLVFACGSAKGVVDSTMEKEVTVTVKDYVCEFSSITGNSGHTAEIYNGHTTSGIGKTTVTASCNDAGGSSIMAVGYSDNTEGNTDLISGSDTIATGTDTSVDTSSWAMMVTPKNGLTTVGSFSSYHAVPATWTKVAQKSSGTIAENTMIAETTYQIHPSNEQPIGNYIGHVKYVLIHPSGKDCPDGYKLKDGTCQEKRPTISEITNMQEMTSAICAASAENETNQLKDIRDNKLYWVTKLKDGNCWMTQNLDLGDNGMKDMVLTPADSDVATNFTLAKPGTVSFISDDVVNYRDPGEQYYVSSGTTADDTSYTSKSACESANSTEVCAHSHAGNYYNWYTATAGTGTEAMTSGEATGSICPKGWRLPFYSSDLGAKSYYNLLRNYGISEFNYTISEFNIIRSNPLYFVRSGDYYRSSLDYAGNLGYYWSSAVYSDSRAHALGFGGGIDPQGSSGKYYGHSVRCLARNTPINVTIAYDKNTTDAVSNMPANQSLSNFDGETTPPTISSQVPIRNGYYFAGWATTSDGERGYLPGDAVYLSASDMPTGDTLTLYAKWIDASTLITFTIGGQSYVAAQGSTWTDWINSFYNTDGFCVRASDSRISYGEWCLAYGGGYYMDGVSSTDFIVSGGSYSWVYRACFVKGTLITLWDGKTKKIEDLTYDDKLLVWNFDEGHYDTASIAWLTESGLHNDHYYKLTFSDGTVLKTTGEKSNHKVFNTDKQYFQGVASIEVGAHVYTENGIVTLVDKEYVEDDVEYYNVITNTHFNVFANGVLTGNRYDNMYNISGMKYIKDNRTIKPYFEFAANGIDRYWYDTLRLGEQSDSMEEIVDYIHKLESQMRERE